MIKPDIHDPDHYLYFHSTGAVIPRSGLSGVDGDCARETIRVFGLDNSVLSGARSRVLAAYKKSILDDLNELDKWSEEDRQAYLNNEIEATSWEPYATTIKHFLQA